MNDDLSIEERIEEIKNTEPAEIVGMLMGLEAVIMCQRKEIEMLKSSKEIHND